jgi:hypothetical protein
MNDSEFNNAYLQNLDMRNAGMTGGDLSDDISGDLGGHRPWGNGLGKHAFSFRRSFTPGRRQRFGLLFQSYTLSYGGLWPRNGNRERCGLIGIQMSCARGLCSVLRGNMEMWKDDRSL